MKQRLAYTALLLMLALIIIGCDSAVDITSITAITYSTGPSPGVSRPHDANPIHRWQTQGVWLNDSSAVWLKVNFPDNLPSGKIKTAHLTIPVVPQDGFITTGSRHETVPRGPSLNVAVHRVLDPYWENKLSSWLGTTHVPPADSSVESTPHATYSLFGPGGNSAYSYVRLDITELMQAWYAGESNFGMLLVSDLRSASVENAGWRHVENLPTRVVRVVSQLGGVEEQKDETPPEKIRISITFAAAP